jgi:hypothetical protein
MSNDGLQPRRAISIQGAKKETTWEACYRAVSRKAFLGIALGGSDLLIVLCNSDEEAQRLIHCVGIGKDIGDVGLQPDNVAKSLASRTELPNPQTSQIILRAKIFF